MKKNKPIFFVAAMLALFMMMPFPTTAATSGPDVVASIDVTQDTSLQANGFVSTNVTAAPDITDRQNYVLNQSTAGISEECAEDFDEESAVDEPFTLEWAFYELPPDETIDTGELWACRIRQTRDRPANRTPGNKLLGFGIFT